jgi:cellulose synthase/poly-beta-1,6-N-acetylglucosamine synthase-like glycosyltransferase
MLIEGDLLGIIQVVGIVLLIGQIGVYTGIFRFLITYKRPTNHAESDFSGGTSVVIAAHNDAENLDANLPYILQQEHDRYEVIVVNDHSADGTIEVVRRLQKTYPHLHLINMGAHVWQKPGKKLALLLGIKKAQYEAILLTDADCYPASKQWIATMESPFTNPETSLVISISPYQKGSGFLSTVVRYETFVTAFQYMGLGMAGMPYMGVGRNLAYRKSLFLANNGFGKYHYLAAGDDDLLVNSLANSKNTDFVLDPNGFTWSVPPHSWRHWFNQKKRHLSVGKHYQFQHKVSLGALWLLQFSFYLVVIPALVINPYETLTWGILLAKVILFYSVSLPVLERFQLMPLALRAFGLDILYQLIYIPLMGVMLKLQRKTRAWG